MLKKMVFSILIGIGCLATIVSCAENTSLLETTDDDGDINTDAGIDADSANDVSIDTVLLQFRGEYYEVTNKTGDQFNHTIIIADLALGSYLYRWIANDSSGNINSTGFYFFNVTSYEDIGDYEAPTWGNMSAPPESPIDYTPNLNFSFNISWYDNFDLDDVFFELNGINYSVESSTDNYSIEFNDIAAGLYDMYATPLDSHFPGVEVNATLIDNILKGDLISEPDWLSKWELRLTLAAGLLTTALVCLLSTWHILPVIVLFICGVWYLILALAGREASRKK